jgi:hypothetical protein
MMFLYKCLLIVSYVSVWGSDGIKLLGKEDYGLRYFLKVLSNENRGGWRVISIGQVF